MIDRNQNINNANPFKVPENYFQDFKKDIMQQVADLETEAKPIVKRTPKVNIWKGGLSWGAIAAMFLGVVFTLNTTLLKDSSHTAASSLNRPNEKKNMIAQSKSTDESEFLQFIEEQSTRKTFNESLFNDDDIY